MTEPLLLFSPSLHTSLQVLKRSLKPTVKLLSVQAAYKEFIQNLHLIFFLSAWMDVWLGFSYHTIHDTFETTLTNIYQCCLILNKHNINHGLSVISCIMCIIKHLGLQYAIITLQGKSKTLYWNT